MKRPVAGPVALEPTVAAPSGESAAEVFKDAGALWRELSELGRAQLKLAALETRRAGHSLITLLGAAVLLAVLLLGAWWGLLAAGIVWLLEQGLPVSAALAAGVGVNLLAALIVYAIIRRQRRYLQFPATRRSLQSLSSRPKEHH